MSNVVSNSAATPGGVATPPTRPSFRPDIEGLRAVAVGLVLAYHAFARPFTGGCVGVDVFFVISGFLITGLLLRENDRSGRISIAGFYARRVRRILPAATVVILATLLAAYYLLGFITGNAVATAAKWTAVFAGNIYFGLLGSDYFGSQLPPSPLDHFWSLGVEEQFYLVWPLLFLALAVIARGRRHRGWLALLLTVIIAASLSWSIVGTHSSATWAYLSPLTRAWELAVGALVAVAAPVLARIDRDWAWQAMAVVGVIGITASSLLLDSRTPYPGSAVVVPVLGSALVIAAGCANPCTYVGRLLAVPPMQWLGARSYSLYIWHWPVLAIAAQYVGHPMSKSQNAGLLVVAVALSALSYALLEDPVRHSTFLAAHTRITLVIGVVLILVTIAVAQVMIVTHDGRSTATATPVLAGDPRDRAFATESQVLEAVRTAAELSVLPDAVASGLTAAEQAAPARGFDCVPVDDSGTGATSFGGCAYGAPAGDKLAVVFGDSRATMWSVPIANVAATRGWKVRVFALAGCSIPNLRFLSGQSGSPNTTCDTFHRAAVNAITRLKPQLVITTSSVDHQLADGSQPTPQEWADGLTSTYAQLAATGAKLAMMGDLPTWDDDDANCLAAHPTQVQECAGAPDAVAPERVRLDAERAATESSGGLYVAPATWVCADACEPVIAGMRVYANRFHLTPEYADYLSGAVGEALGPVMS